MIINKTHLSHFLGDSQLGHFVDYSEVYYPWFDKDYVKWIAYGPSSFQVILNLSIIIILIIYVINKDVENNSFYFIINLATTDIVGFLMFIIVMQIKDHDYTLYDPDVSSSKRSDMCPVKQGLLAFSYLNTISATLLLTVDRFLFISKSLKYGVLVTKESCLKLDLNKPPSNYKWFNCIATKGRLHLRKKSSILL